MTNKYIAIVTARSGSKRLPNKNILNLCGKPLFIWSVIAGLKTPKIERTIVSTDSYDYQQLALKAGAECPVLRDSHLSDDEATSADVVKSVLDGLGDSLTPDHSLILLQPTSPLRTYNDINKAIELYETRQAPAVVSVTDLECSPHWTGILRSDLCMDDFASYTSNSVFNSKSSNWYRLNGAIYIISVQHFYRVHDFIPKGTLAYVMSRQCSVDVDTFYDFKVAEALLNLSESSP